MVRSGVVGVQRGTIIWANIADKVRRSESKERPALVISPNDKIAQCLDLAVLVISTKFTYPPPSGWFMVPSDPFGNEITGLDRPSVIKTDWPEWVPQSNVLATKGRVPASLYKQAINYLKQEIEKRNQGR
jgi:mRNA-degrading endonuclease toxin of MazEF toxin-antitoxin module